MICASFGNVDYENLKSQIQLYEIAEIRLDLLEINLNQVSEIFASHKNLIATLHFADLEPTESEMQLLETAINSGAAWVDIDIFLKGNYRSRLIELSRKNNVKVIFSFHDYEKTPSIDELKNHIELGFQNAADVVKIACFANSYSDTARILSLYNDSRPIIALSMGEKGKISRTLALVYGAPFTFGYPKNISNTAPGQLSIKELYESVEVLRGAESENQKLKNK